MLNLLLAFKNLDPMNWTNLKHAFNFLWQGLLAIFVVIGLIIIAVKITAYAIDKCGEAKKKKSERHDDNNQTPQV